jgi:hypothetical protein
LLVTIQVAIQLTQEAEEEGVPLLEEPLLAEEPPLKRNSRLNSKEAPPLKHNNRPSNKERLLPLPRHQHQSLGQQLLLFLMQVLY